jgi:hypothetical protein
MHSALVSEPLHRTPGVQPVTRLSKRERECRHQERSDRFVQGADGEWNWAGRQCIACLEWLSLGPSNDVGVEVEIRAAEIAAATEMPKCDDGPLEERCVRCGWEGWISDYAAPSDAWLAGYLARCITSHQDPG